MGKEAGMIVETGHYALVLALALALVNSVLPVWGSVARDQRLMAVAPPVALMGFDPAPPGSGPRYPPTAALSRLCRTFHHLFLRGGGFDFGPHRCGLRTFRAALDVDRLDFLDPWHSDGLLLGLLHAWLGRLLVLG